MSKMSDIHLEASESIDGAGMPDEVYEDAIIEEARRILMNRAGTPQTLESQQLKTLNRLVRSKQRDEEVTDIL